MNTRDLEYVIELVLWSGRIKNADPLSLIVSSKVGAGKTAVVMQYRDCRGVQHITEPTAYGIRRNYLEKNQAGEITHLLFGLAIGCA